MLANQCAYVPSPSTSWNRFPNVWKNSNGRANQKPNDWKMFAWVLVELMMIQTIGIRVKMANSTQHAVSSETVPRLSP